MNKHRNIIVKILIIIMTLILICVMVYSFITIKKEENKEISKEIKIYLNDTYKNEKVKSKSPIYGLLNYNFEDLNTISTDQLIYTNFMSSSQMDETEIDSIYNGEFGINKSIYMESNKFISNPNTNCYFHQNILKKEIDCKNICSKNAQEMIKVIKEKLEWTNILPEDLKIFCIENPQFSLEENGYLEKTHISSGRIPSEKGYRYYVDNIMKPKELTGEDMLKLQTIFNNNSLVLDDYITKSMEIISEMTNLTAVVLGKSSLYFCIKEISNYKILRYEKDDYYWGDDFHAQHEPPGYGCHEYQ